MIFSRERGRAFALIEWQFMLAGGVNRRLNEGVSCKGRLSLHIGERFSLIFVAFYS